jgi:hypothetical protein
MKRGISQKYTNACTPFSPYLGRMNCLEICVINEIAITPRTAKDVDIDLID